MPRIPVVAHRGYALRFPENTLSAVRGALEHGARFVEIDVQLSADGTAYLFHDGELGRMTGRSGSFMQLRDGEVARLRAPEAGRFGERFAEEPVATLAQLAELLAAHPEVECFVEAKGESLAIFGVEAMLAALRAPLEPVDGRWILISFELEILEAARRQGAPTRLGPVLHAWSDLRTPRVRALQAEFVFCDRLKLPPSGPLDAGGAKLVVYEVADPAEARALLARGAFALETFRSAELAAALGAEPRR